MRYQFHKTGAERTALVAVIRAVTSEKTKYLGAPGFAYRYRVSRHNIPEDGAVQAGNADAAAVASLLPVLHHSSRFSFPILMDGFKTRIISLSV